MLCENFLHVGYKCIVTNNLIMSNKEFEEVWGVKEKSIRSTLYI